MHFTHKSLIKQGFWVELVQLYPPSQLSGYDTVLDNNEKQI